VPSYVDELKIMFPGTLSFGKLSNSISFDAKYLKKPLVRTHKEVKKFLAHHPANIMAIPGGETTLESRIEREIMDMDSSKLNFPKVSALANKLNMSSLMLYRKLKEEGTSYQKIKDDMRRELSY
jgi:AraC-like DNA-binding protein